MSDPPFHKEGGSPNQIPEVVDLNAHALTDAIPGPNGTRTLSAREFEALTWAAKGKTYWETAAIIGVSYASVHGYVDSLKLKMGAANITHAVARGYELGILQGTRQPKAADRRRFRLASAGVEGAASR
jgi:DNA-binding CsgD family transcriptional regulator